MKKSNGAAVLMRQVVIYPDREDGGWVAEVPSLPGCITQGESRLDVLANARDAIETWIAGAEEAGLAVPEESFDVQVCMI